MKKQHPVETEIARKTGFGLMMRMSLPKFPAVEIGGTVVFDGCNVTQEQLGAVIKTRQGRPRRLAPYDGRHTSGPALML